METKLKKVVTYARYSSKNQKYGSIVAQQRAMRKHCKGKYEIVKEYVDEAKTATNANRPQFQQMIVDTKNSDIYAVIVHKLDRFSRSKVDTYAYKAILEKRGIKLISVEEPVNMNNIADELLADIIIVLNEFYSKNLAREVQKGKKEGAYKCLHLGGTPAYGYDVDNDRKYIINPKESQAVKKIFAMYLNDYSYQAIADYLNKHGYKTKKGLEFNKNSFSSILENAERYSGVYIYNRTEKKRLDGTRNSHAVKADDEIIRIPDGMPSIISKETYHQFLHKVESNRNTGSLFHSKRYYLLNGVIRCGKCGRMYSGCASHSGRSKKLYSSYKCPNSRDSCKNKSVSMKYINEYVLKLILDSYCTQANNGRIIKKLNSKVDRNNKEITNKVVSLKNSLKHKQGALKKVLSIDNDGASSIVDNLMVEIRDLKDEILKFETSKQVPYTETDVMMAERLFIKYMLQKNTPLCRKLIRSIVKKVLVYDDRIEVTLSV